MDRGEKSEWDGVKAMYCSGYVLFDQRSNVLFDNVYDMQCNHTSTKARGGQKQHPTSPGSFEPHETSSAFTRVSNDFSA
jgi:hypothetical protein